MTEKRLDPKLSEAFLEILKRNSPAWTHQEEIYQFVENQVDFTENQIAFACTKAGQIEPNWQHDLRNLQHTLKRNGTVINPDREIWAMPVESIEVKEVMNYWYDCVLQITGSTDNVPSVHSNSGQIIERQLFIERVHHLLQCGGILPKGRMHNWSRIEQALVSVSPEIEIMGNWIISSSKVRDLGAEDFYRVIEDVTNKATEAKMRGSSATSHRINLGKVRRTMSELQGDDNGDFGADSENQIPLLSSNNSPATFDEQNEENQNLVDTPSDDEHGLEDEIFPEEETDSVRYEVCSTDPEKGFHNTPYEELTHRIDAPPGLNKSYFCPACGCPFVATQNNRLIFFRHAGRKRLSSREFFDGWPEATHGPWSVAKDKLDYVAIHNALGDNLTPNVIREKSRNEIRESLKSSMQIAYTIGEYRDGIFLNIWFSEHGMGSDWKIILSDGTELDFLEESGMHYLELPDTTSSVTIRSPQGSEQTLNLPPPRLIMNAGSIEEATAFYHYDPRFRSKDEADGAMLVESSKQSSKINIGGKDYSTSSLDDQYSIRIGLPHYDGRVILQEGMTTLPLIFQEGGEWKSIPSNRLRLQTVDLEPFFLPSNRKLMLNSERMRREKELTPRVQIRVPAVDQTIALESYPLTFDEIKPSSVVLDIDGNQYPVGNPVEVLSKPSSIHLIAQGKRINLDKHKTKLWYKDHLNESKVKITEGSLNEMLKELKGLSEQWFVLAFEMNRSQKIYDRQTIMMKPIPPLNPEQAIWYSSLKRSGKKRWKLICNNSKANESENAQVLEKPTFTAGFPTDLKEVIEKNRSEIVTWLTTYRRQRG